jgi:hypothetical protein
MLLVELTDTQVASAFIDQDPQQRRQDNVKTPQQLARDRAANIAAERTSKDPLKMRIAQLRSQLATLIVQDQKKTADAQKQAAATAGSPAPGTVAGTPAVAGAPATPSQASR